LTQKKSRRGGIFKAASPHNDQHNDVYTTGLGGMPKLPVCTRQFEEEGKPGF